MKRRYSRLMTAIVALVFTVTQTPAFAGTPMSDRVAVAAKVRAEVGKDLAVPYNPGEALADRQCLDGRPVKDFQGDLVEYWVNLECSYCGIREPLQAQRAVQDMCIVVRHIPPSGTWGAMPPDTPLAANGQSPLAAIQYGESLKKALSYEALKKFSVNAAHLFKENKEHKKRSIS